MTQRPLRILMIAYYFPPYLSAGASRAGQLAKYLSRAGLDLQVITAHSHDLPLKSDIDVDVPIVYGRNFEVNAIPARILRRDLRERGYGMSRSMLARLLGATYKQIVNFPDPQIGWIPGALAAANGVAGPKPDVVLSSSPPASAHMAAALYARRHDVPWVAEFRDPWVDNPHFTRWWPARIAERRLHDAVVARATAVVAISRSFASAYSLTLGRHVLAIPNGFDPDDFTGSAEVAPGELSHPGTMYAAYDSVPLLRGVKLSHRDLSVVFSGRNVGDLARQINEIGVGDRVRLVGPVLRSKAIAQMRRSEANIFFFVRRLRPLATVYVQQKLYEYLGAGRPVLGIGDPRCEAGDILADSGLGVFADTADKVAALLDRGVTHPHIDRSVVDRYSYPVIADEYARLFRSIVR